jgi:hypothetical protein
MVFTQVNMVFTRVNMVFTRVNMSRHYHSDKSVNKTYLRENGLADEVHQHPIVVGELVRPITTDINAIVTAAPQQRLEIYDLTLASENPAIDNGTIFLRDIESLQHEHA